MCGMCLEKSRRKWNEKIESIFESLFDFSLIPNKTHSVIIEIIFDLLSQYQNRNVADDNDDDGDGIQL